MKKIILLLILSLIVIGLGISEVTAASDAEKQANDILNKTIPTARFL